MGRLEWRDLLSKGSHQEFCSAEMTRSRSGEAQPLPVWVSPFNPLELNSHTCKMGMMNALITV